MSCSRVAHQLNEAELLSNMINFEYIILSWCSSGEQNFRYTAHSWLWWGQNLSSPV